MASIALVIPVGCLVLLAGAAVSGITFGSGRGGEDSWKAKVKVAALASSFLGGGGSASVIAIAAAVLVALVIAHLAHGRSAAVGTAVLLVAGWLIVISVLNTIVDVTYIGDASDSGDTGYIVGLLVSDVGALAVACATAVLGERFLKA